MATDITSKNFSFDTGISRVWDNNTLPLNRLPDNASLLPGDTTIDTELSYGIPPPSFMNRALKALQPELGEEREVVLPDNYDRQRQAVTEIFKNPSEELIQALKDQDGSDWLIESMKTQMLEIDKEQSLLQDGFNALIRG